MYILPIAFASPEYDETVQLRNDVLRKPLNLEFSIEYIEKEYTDTHLACYTNEGGLLGCLLLTPHDSKVVQMRQVAVRDDAQRRGVGTYLVQYAEVFAKTNGYTTLMLHARLEAVPFYEKLQYQTQGEMFEEVGIAHYAMQKERKYDFGMHPIIKVFGKN